MSSVDIATKKNLNNLVKVGEELLKKPVSRVDLETGNYEASNHETNEQALKRYSSFSYNNITLPYIYKYMHIIGN